MIKNSFSSFVNPIEAEQAGIVKPIMLDAEFSFIAIQNRSNWDTPGKVYAYVQERKRGFVQEEKVYRYQGLSIEELELVEGYEKKKAWILPETRKKFKKDGWDPEAYKEATIRGKQIMDILLTKAKNYYHIPDPLFVGKTFLTKSMYDKAFVFMPF